MGTAVFVFGLLLFCGAVGYAVYMLPTAMRDMAARKKAKHEALAAERRAQEEKYRADIKAHELQRAQAYRDHASMTQTNTGTQANAGAVQQLLGAGLGQVFGVHAATGHLYAPGDDYQQQARLITTTTSSWPYFSTRGFR